MTRSITIVLLGGLLVLIAGSGAPAWASQSCGERSDLLETERSCTYTAERARERYHRSVATKKHRFRLLCEYNGGGLCAVSFVGCRDEEKDTYLMEEATVGREDWGEVAYLCLGDESEVTEGVTEIEVRRAFQELTWPEATLVMQPPDGETLVNLPTIFLTRDTEAQSHSVTLLGVQVEIEATPTSWTWHWAQPGDNVADGDLAAHTTTTPGAAYPHETITHAYRRASDSVRPSVDVTYTGRYRINGGTWTDIDGTHLVTGTPQSLSVLEARPTRVR